MNSNLQSVFKEFAELLNNRFKTGIFTKEDAIRYTFFYSICKNMFKPEDVILEDRHPFLEGEKEIDMRIESSENSDELVFEFKYDVKRTSISPKPYKAGKLFADIFRLEKFKSGYSSHSRCFLIYVTDFELADYMSKDENRLDDFFNLQEGKLLKINSEYIHNHSNTFVNEASKYGITDCQILSCLSDVLANDHFLRIYEVNGLNSEIEEKPKWDERYCMLCGKVHKITQKKCPNCGTGNSEAEWYNEDGSIKS